MNNIIIVALITALSIVASMLISGAESLRINRVKYYIY